MIICCFRSVITQHGDLTVLGLFGCVKASRSECICSTIWTSEDNKSSVAISLAERINRNTQSRSWQPVPVVNYIKYENHVRMGFKPVLYRRPTWCQGCRTASGNCFPRSSFISRDKHLLKAIQLTLYCFVQVSLLLVPDVWVHTCGSLSVLHLHSMGLVRKVITTLGNTSIEVLFCHSVQL